MFSRYFPRDVNLHSFDNGLSKTAKKDNWRQLRKLFKMWGFEVNNTRIDGILNARSGFIVPFVADMYTFLTARKIALDKYEKQGMPIDMAEMGAEQKSFSTESKAEEKSSSEDVIPVAVPKLEASVASSGSRAAGPGNKVMRGTPRTVGVAETNPQVQVNDVSIRQVDRDVMKIRAKKQQSIMSSVYSNQLEAQSSIGSGSMLGHSESTTSMSMSEIMSSLAIDKDSLLREVQMSELPTIGGKDGSMSSRKPKVSSVMKSLRGLEARSHAVADSIVADPSEFETLVDVLCGVFEVVTNESPLLAQLGRAFRSIGCDSVGMDDRLTYDLFVTFALPRICLALNEKHAPSKRQVAMDALWAFTNNSFDAHKRMVKDLREAVPDLGRFLQNVLLLFRKEPEFDPELVDLYSYYSLIGLTSASPNARAAALHMVPKLLNFDLEHTVASILPSVLRMAREKPVWWEESAALVVAAAEVAKFGLMAEELEEGLDIQLMTLADQLLQACLQPARMSCETKIIAVSAWARYICNFPDYLSVYVKIALSLPSTSLRALLQGEPSLITKPDSAQLWNLTNPAESWGTIAIVLALVFNHTEKHEDQPLDENELLLLTSAFESEEDCDPSHEDAWQQCWMHLAPSLFSGFNKSNTVELSGNLLRFFTFHCENTKQVLNHPGWVPALLTVCASEFQQKNELAAKTMIRILEDAAAESDKFRRVVLALLMELQSKEEFKIVACPDLECLFKIVAE